MKVIGVIAEYNPFHLGHLHLINKIKEMEPDSLIISIISPCFTERGEISVINKWDKTNICLSNGIDLVVELPTLYAIQSADRFAYAAINILHELKIDTLVFGSESNDVDMLVKLANIQLYDDNYDLLVKKYLESGINYPTAMSKALDALSDIKLDSPNDLLALSYIKEIIRNKYAITPISIKRTNDYHGKKVNSNVINASLIRKMIGNNEDVSKYLPSNVINYIDKNANINNAFSYLKYNILINKDNIANYLTINEGFENRILKYINSVNDWDSFVKSIKTKRYTYNNINRMLVHILLGIKKEDNTDSTYIRIIGFNNNGKKYLNSIKKKVSIPIYTNYKFNKSSVLDLEYKTTCIYSLIVNKPELIDMEYKNRPIMK